MSQPPSPPPPPPYQQPPAGPAGRLVVNLQGSALTSNLVSPTVTLNGYGVPTRYGENVLPVAPGRIHVEVYTQWMRRYGQAAIDVDVPPGRPVVLWYATPWHQFTTGSIGFEKQKRKGGGFMLALLLVLVLVVVGIAVLGAQSG